MRYLIDTDWVIDYLKGKAEADQLLDPLVHEGLAISYLRRNLGRYLLWKRPPTPRADFSRLFARDPDPAADRKWHGALCPYQR